MPPEAKMVAPLCLTMVGLEWTHDIAGCEFVGCCDTLQVAAQEGASVDRVVAVLLDSRLTVVTVIRKAALYE